MTEQLLPGYSVEVDNPDKESWHRNVDKFSDANIFQTWPYVAVHTGEKSLSNLLLKRDGKVVAAAQARIARIPYANIGVAYILYGPMWQVSGEPIDLEVFSQALRAIRNEYACRRHLAVRIQPLIFNDQASIFDPILAQEGYDHPSTDDPQRTLLIDLNPSLQELRKGLDQKWRNRLNRGEKNNLNTIEGFDDDLFRLFLEIYQSMHDRKSYLETVDVEKYRIIQRDLPEFFKMRIFIAFHDDKPAAGVICSGIGDMGIYLFGATSDSGLTAQGSYVLQWRALSWLKEIGATWYNLNGINPIANPGTYHFKSGMCGKNGRDLKHLGLYDASNGAVIRKAFEFADLMRVKYRKNKEKLKKVKGTAGSLK
jgi:hypothetical protein